MKAAILQSQIALSVARANWWAAYANTPANLAREVTRGSRYNSHTLSRDELIDDAMTTANAHLTQAQEALDALTEIAP